MKYLIKEKAWSFKSGFNIEDEHGAPVYVVKGTFFSMRGEMSVQDLAGNVLLTLCSKLLSWRPTYLLKQNGAVIAKLIKRTSMFKPRFVLELGSEHMEIKGKFWSHEYRFTAGGREVAVITKPVFQFRDAYTVDVDESVDPLLILCACLMIDQIREKQSSDGSSSSGDD